MLNTYRYTVHICWRFYRIYSILIKYFNIFVVRTSSECLVLCCYCACAIVTCWTLAINCHNSVVVIGLFYFSSLRNCWIKNNEITKNVPIRVICCLLNSSALLACTVAEWLHFIFTSLHASHAVRSSHEKAVHLSVRPSVCQTRGLWQNERNVCQHSYTTWKIAYHGFLRRRMVGGEGVTSSTWNFGSHWPVGVKSPIFNRYSLVAPQP